MLKAGTAARRRSLSWTTTADPEAIRASVEQFLQALDRRLQEKDLTWVGHCKLLLSSDGGSGYASLTAAGDTARWAGSVGAVERAEMTVYVAIYSWTDADVAAALDATLASEPLATQPDLAAG